MKISIQGLRGSYSHIAAENLFGKEIELLERETFAEVFDDVSSGNSDYSVIPIENSTYGSIYQNYDNLTKNDLHIVKEIYLKINFHLIINPESSLDKINELYTHPVALGQIKGFLQSNPQIKAIEYFDTGAGVKMIKDKKMLNAAGAASRLAAEMNGMKIVSENIQDNPKNYTRFFVLSKKEEYPIDSNKTTIEFELGEEVGSLAKVLNIFANTNISLTKIESRPILNTDWEYTFYVDLLSGINDSKMKSSLEEVKNIARHLRILGSYKRGVEINT